jgi:hypothetical protein
MTSTESRFAFFGIMLGTAGRIDAGVAELVDALDLGVGAKFSTFRKWNSANPSLSKSTQAPQ